jgi:toluene monooxygenase system protein B
MALFPITSNFEGDFVLKLVPVDDENTMAEVAEAAAVHSINLHVAEQPGKVIRARRAGESEPFPLEVKLKDSGLMPTECVDFYYE